MMCNFRQASELPYLERHVRLPLPARVSPLDSALLAVAVAVLALFLAMDMAAASSVSLVMAMLQFMVMFDRFVTVTDLKRQRRDIDRLMEIVGTPTVVQDNENIVFTYVRPSQELMDSIERTNRVLDGQKKVK